MSQRDSHETYQVAASRLHWVALILVGSLLAIVLSMYWLAKPLMQSVAHLPAAAQPPAPRLQPDPARDLAALRDREQDRLDGYGWIDRNAGIAHIPIDRAMALLTRLSLAGQAPGRHSSIATIPGQTSSSPDASVQATEPAR